MDTTLSQLRLILLSVLGTGGINVLGQYKLGTLTIPSIQVRNTTATYTLVPKSGIECVIEPNPAIAQHNNQGGVLMDRLYLVTLDQHDPTKTLVEAIETINSLSIIRPLTSPVIRGRTELNGAELPARAVLYIPAFTYQRGLM
jgi:hypothetical protein